MARRLTATLAVLALTGAVSAQPAQPGATLGARPGALSANGPAAVSPVPGTLVHVSRRENPVVSIQEFVRVEDRMPNTFVGIGLVTGLNKTGDDGKDLVLARPLAELYKNLGNPIAELKDLANSRSAAIVTVTVTVPEGGGAVGDPFDVHVQASHSAKSLKGGTLLASALVLPRKFRPGESPKVYAMAAGEIVIEEPDIPTRGFIGKGATLIQSVLPNPVGNSFNLILRPEFRSFQMAQTIAAEINDLNADLDATSAAPADEILAAAMDDVTIRVTVPKAERGNPAHFVAGVMGKKFSPSLMDLPAMVVVNEKTGVIIVTGDVEISSVTVGTDRLQVTTSTPPPVPTAQDPLVTHQNWAEFGTTTSSGDRARIQDLLEAFKQLNVPAKEQIQILSQIHQTGRLHARFIRQ